MKARDKFHPNSVNCPRVVFLASKFFSSFIHLAQLVRSPRHLKSPRGDNIAKDEQTRQSKIDKYKFSYLHLRHNVNIYVRYESHCVSRKMRM